MKYEIGKADRAWSFRWTDSYEGGKNFSQTLEKIVRFHIAP